MTINGIYKKILEAYDNQNFDVLKKTIKAMYQYDSIWFYLFNSEKKYIINVKNGLYSSTSQLKRLAISQDVFNWLSNSLKKNRTD